VNDQLRAFPILKKYLHSTLSIKGELKKYRAAFLCGLFIPLSQLIVARSIRNSERFQNIISVIKDKKEEEK